MLLLIKEYLLLTDTGNKNSIVKYIILLASTSYNLYLPDKLMTPGLEKWGKSVQKKMVYPQSAGGEGSGGELCRWSIEGMKESWEEAAAATLLS